MRDYIFRGKTESGGWVYGSLIHAGKYCCILESEADVHPMDYPYLDNDLGTFDGYATPVIPETVGQFTGLLDKNGNRIFEGDILQTRRYETYTEELKGYYGYDVDGYPQKIPGYTGSMIIHNQRTNDNYHAVVCFDLVRGFYINGASVRIDAICNTVIGNVHDNPELLKGE